MTGHGFSKRLLDFLVEHIFSVEQVEILLLLREHKARSWSVREVNQAVRSSEDSVSARLEDLQKRSFITLVDAGDKTFQYRPENDLTEQLISELATAYRERRAKLIEFIYSKPSREIQSFSNAFCIRKEDVKSRKDKEDEDG